MKTTSSKFKIAVAIIFGVIIVVAISLSGSSEQFTGNIAGTPQERKEAFEDAIKDGKEGYNNARKEAREELGKSVGAAKTSEERDAARANYAKQLKKIEDDGKYVSPSDESRLRTANEAVERQFAAQEDLERQGVKEAEIDEDDIEAAVESGAISDTEAEMFRAQNKLGDKQDEFDENASALKEAEERTRGLEDELQEAIKDGDQDAIEEKLNEINKSREEEASLEDKRAKINEEQLALEDIAAGNVPKKETDPEEAELEEQMGPPEPTVAEAAAVAAAEEAAKDVAAREQLLKDNPSLKDLDEAAIDQMVKDRRNIDKLVEKGVLTEEEAAKMHEALSQELSAILRNKPLIIPRPSSLPGISTELQKEAERMSPGFAGVGIRAIIFNTLFPNFVKGFLGFVAITSTVALILSGIFFIIAYGDEEKIGKAKRAAMTATIGLLIAMGSYAIVSIITRLPLPS